MSQVLFCLKMNNLSFSEIPYQSAILQTDRGNWSISLDFDLEIKEFAMRLFDDMYTQYTRAMTACVL